MTSPAPRTWDDDGDRDGARPSSITVRLLADGTEVDSTTVTADDSWAYSFSGLAKYNADGSEIAYTVTEDAVSNYATAIEGTSITNSYTPGKTSVTVTKAWDDANNQDGIRTDSVKVQLYANGEPTGDAVELSADNQWTHTWTDLFQKEGGQDITYTSRRPRYPKAIPPLSLVMPRQALPSPTHTLLRPHLFLLPRNGLVLRAPRLPFTCSLTARTPAKH